MKFVTKIRSLPELQLKSWDDPEQTATVISIAWAIPTGCQ